MANPFSGLENIGYSYIAGARLAQERQRRADEILARQEEARIRQQAYEDAAAARREDARIREQYYQDTVAERKAAREETAKARAERAAAQFGEDVVYNPAGEIDYRASAAAAQARQRNARMAEAMGMLSGEGEATGPISSEIMASPEYARGRATTLGKRLAEQRAVARAIMSSGYRPVSEKPAPAYGFEPDYVTPRRDESSDIVVGNQRFEPTPLTRARVASRLPAEKAPRTPYTITTKGPNDERIVRKATEEEYQSYVANKPKEEAEVDDIGEARKQLKSLVKGGTDEFNININPKTGKIDIVPDSAWSIGRSAEEIMADLKLEETRRKERLKALSDEESTAPGARRVPPPMSGVLMEMEPAVSTGRTNLPQRVPVNQQNRVIDLRSIQGLPPLRGR